MCWYEWKVLKRHQRQMSVAASRRSVDRACCLLRDSNTEIETARHREIKRRMSVVASRRSPQKAHFMHQHQQERARYTHQHQVTVTTANAKPVKPNP